MFFCIQIHFLHSILRRPHTHRISDDVLKKLRRSRNRVSCEKNTTGAEKTGIQRIPAGNTNLVLTTAYYCSVVEAKDPSKMALTSLSSSYKVFHNLHMLWMCIWMSPYHVTASLVGKASGSYLELWVPP
jgi:hypothetical protein